MTDRERELSERVDDLVKKLAAAHRLLDSQAVEYCNLLDAQSSKVDQQDIADAQAALAEPGRKSWEQVKAETTQSVDEAAVWYWQDDLAKFFPTSPGPTNTEKMMFRAGAEWAAAQSRSDSAEDKPHNPEIEAQHWCNLYYELKADAERMREALAWVWNEGVAAGELKDAVRNALWPRQESKADSQHKAEVPTQAPNTAPTQPASEVARKIAAKYYSVHTAIGHQLEEDILEALTVTRPAGEEK